MKVKNDHRSKFFFQLKHLERRSLEKIRASTDTLIFLQASSFQLLKLKKIYCDDHFSLSL